MGERTKNFKIRILEFSRIRILDFFRKNEELLCTILEICNVLGLII